MLGPLSQLRDTLPQFSALLLAAARREVAAALDEAAHPPLPQCKIRADGLDLGLTRGAVPTPVVGFNNVYCMTGFQDPQVMAIELGNTGDLTGSDAISWHVSASAPYIPCPVLYDNRLYMIENMKGILSCYDAETGEALYEGQRLEGMKKLYSSPVAAAG